MVTIRGVNNMEKTHKVDENDLPLENCHWVDGKILIQMKSDFGRPRRYLAGYRMGERVFTIEGVKGSLNETQTVPLSKVDFWKEV